MSLGVAGCAGWHGSWIADVRLLGGAESSRGYPGNVRGGWLWVNKQQMSSTMALCDFQKKKKKAFMEVTHLIL